MASGLAVQGTTATYTKANLCSGLSQGTGYFDPGSIHTANMTGLAPSTRYYYIYGSDVSPPLPDCPSLGSSFSRPAKEASWC